MHPVIRDQVRKAGMREYAAGPRAAKVLPASATSGQPRHSASLPVE
jgi:hypothetical protein